MAERGKLSRAWRLYTGTTMIKARRRSRFRMPESSGDEEGMCDFIEGAEWWIARSRKSAYQIRRAFERQDVAITLIERTGALLELGQLPVMRQYLIAIQLVRTGQDWDLDLTLEELGVYIEELWDGDDVDPDEYDHH